MEPAHQKLTDEELARLTRTGSFDAFEELVRRHEGRLYGFLARQCRCAADARALTQDTFVRAYQAIGQFRSDRRFAPWLFAIARRKAIDHFRAQPPTDATPLPEPCDENTPAELLARADDRQALWQFARAHLSDSQFQALWLSYAMEMDVADIAVVLRKTRTHVKVLLFRARQKLAAEFGRRSANTSAEASFASSTPRTQPHSPPPASLPPAWQKGLP